MGRFGVARDVSCRQYVSVSGETCFIREETSLYVPPAPWETQVASTLPFLPRRVVLPEPEQ